MILLIVESPSKAKTINQYLGKDYKVISSYGHVRGLPSTAHAVNTDADFASKYQVMDQSKKHVTEIIKQAKNADEVYLATDPDREGEAISWHISEILRENKINTPIKRVVFYEITKKAILKAVSEPSTLNNNLVEAQRTRQILDYLYGFTLSPVLWRKLPGARSAGRVQSVALKIICDREGEIEIFKPQEYWSITGQFTNDKANIITTNLIQYNGKKLDKMTISSRQEAEEIVETLAKNDLAFKVSNIEKKETKRHPMAPFTTSTLMQDASRKLGFSAKKTAMVAQKLYEGIDLGGETQGLITYMRTDSVTVSADAITAARQQILDEFGKNYLPASPKMYKTKSKNAQEAHEAIRPTDVAKNPEQIRNYLSNDEFKLYQLIWNRLVASQMESAIFDQVTCIISDEGNQHQFKATGSTLRFDGYLKVYNVALSDDEEEEEGKLPALSPNQTLKKDKITPNQHFTKPPPRYTEASLVKKMEELGIGRPSTYPAIISILQERNYVKLDRKRFIAEARGRLVSAFLDDFFSQYIAYDFTARMEDELDEISNGKNHMLKVLKHFWGDFKNKTDEVIEFKNSDVIERLQHSLHYYVFGDKSPEDLNCPSCKDGKLSLKIGKYGMFIGCSNYPECNYISRVETENNQAALEHGSSETSPASGGDNMDSGSKGTSTAAGAEEMQFPISLGHHPKTGLEIMLKKGPYGVYAEIIDPDLPKKSKPRRASIPKTKAITDVDISYAVELLSLPRVVGVHPETNKEIVAGFGRFGPYVSHDGKFTSIKGYDPLLITLTEAVDKITENSKKEGKRRSPTAKKPKK